MRTEFGLQAGEVPLPIVPLESTEMSHGIRRVRDFRIVGPYTLDITFDDGSDRVIDFRPILRADLFGPLQDLDLFNRVIVDREVHTLVWPNGADFDPETLHDWQKYVTALTERAQNWKPQPVELLK